MDFPALFISNFVKNHRIFQISQIRKLTLYIPYISTSAAHSGKICPFLQRTPGSILLDVDLAIGIFTPKLKIRMEKQFYFIFTKLVKLQ